MKALLEDRRLLAHVGLAVLVQALAAVGGLAGVLLREATSGTLSDVGIYYRYASRILDGAWPYRDFRVEYPPLAALIFLLPRLVARDRVVYAIIFGCLMFLVNCALVILVAAAVRARQERGVVSARLGWYTACFSALCPLAVVRFDLVPALLCAASLLAWFGGRRVAGGLMAAAGALVKVFPVLIAGLASVSDFRKRPPGAFRGAAAFLAALITRCALWFVLGGNEGVRSSIRFQSQRGLEVESVYSGLILLSSAAGWRGASLTYDETSWHVRVPWSKWVESTSLLLQFAGVLAAYWRFHRGGAADPVRWSAAAVVACVAASKVLSPQFMLWILPLVALLEGRLGGLARTIFLPCCAATSLVFPWCFLGLLRGEAFPILVLNLRNLMLAGLLFLLLLYREPRPRPLARTAEGGDIRA
jgi:hypothetical protein